MTTVEAQASEIRGPVGPWPALPLAEWADTRDTLHLWTQVVGKVRMAVEAPLNHWWHVPLYVGSRGLTTSLMHHPRTPFEVVFDFRRQHVAVECVDGKTSLVPLYARSVSDFYEELMATLRQMHLDVVINPSPVEVEESIPFPEDSVHAAYDADRAIAFWRSLVSARSVLHEHAGRFRGKNSPTHFFWGAFDLAQTRFSGRPAPRHPGGAPNVPDWVMVEAYSHEVSSCGYWPGGDGEGFFYAYSYPEPPGYRSYPMPPHARYDDVLCEFVLPYEDVRRSADPHATLLDFYASASAAAAELAEWEAALAAPGRRR